MPAFSPTTPGGYVVHAHTMEKTPRKSVHPTVNGGQINTQHGFTQEKKIYAKFCQKTDIEPIIALHEIDGFSRKEEPSISHSVGEQLHLYDFQITLVRYTAI